MFFTKIKCLFVVFIASMMIALTACNSTKKVTATPTPDRSPEVRTDMGKYNQCFSQMNVDCMASMFAPNGAVYNTGLLQASGPDAIRSYMKSVI